jgi:hypothetical protein
MMVDGRKLNANSMALGLEILSGKPFTVLCVDCLETADPTESKISRRVGGPGHCCACPYTDGPELFIVNMTLADATAIDVEYNREMDALRAEAREIAPGWIS